MNSNAKNIEHVVVLMMENRSFDHLLGGYNTVNSDCDGVSNSHTNTVGSKTYIQSPIQNAIPYPKHFDLGHEFINVHAQLGSLSQPTMSGFAQQATDTISQKFNSITAQMKEALIQSAMNYYPFRSDGSPDSLPGIHTLARNFAVCDRWFASVPGPTWPNRFFAMMGSCHGRVKMPESNTDIGTAVRGIASQLGKDNIFSILANEHQIYSDFPFPLSTLLKGASLRESIGDFKRDAKNGNLPKFTWIEPNFSSDVNKANSQHPPEDILRGDKFIAEIYDALRSSPLWENTLLVIIYDEHGGFYDHVAPPNTVAPDNIPADVDFKSDRLGVRVPAILVSPWLKSGIVKGPDQQKVDYDHTSLLAFICDLFGHSNDKSKLGKRTQQAKHFGDADIWLDTPRSDAPENLADKIKLRTSAQVNPSSDLETQQRGLVNSLSELADIATESQANKSFFQTIEDQLADEQRRAQNIRLITAWNRQQGGPDTSANKITKIKSTFNRDEKTTLIPGH